MLKEEERQYTYNSIKGYSLQAAGDIDNYTNILGLKADVYICFDNRLQVIMLKPSDSIDGPTYYVVYIITRKAADFYYDFYNIPVQYLNILSKAYLFVRFIQAILLPYKQFITAGLKRVVVKAVTMDGYLSQEVNTRDRSYLALKYARKRKSGIFSATNSEAEESEEDDDGYILNDDDGFVAPLIKRRRKQERCRRDRVIPLSTLRNL